MTNSVLAEYRQFTQALIAPGAPFALETVAGKRGPVRLLAGTRASLLDLYDECIAQFGTRDMIEAEGRRYTFGQIFADAVRLGAALRARHGIGRGDRVALAMRNRPEWFVAFIAATRIGAVATLLNSRAAGEEMLHAASLVGASIVIADERCAERLYQAGCTARIVASEQIAALVAEGGPDESAASIAAEDVAAILFTSGTTGRPKGATLTHRNLAAASRLLGYMGTLGLQIAARRSGVDAATLSERMPRPSLLLSFPLFHISGVTNFMVSITSGALLTLMRRWDPDEALRLIEKNRVTGVQGPSLVLKDLLDRPGAPARLQTLTAITVGGQATPATLTAQINRLLPRASQGTGWGMTEVTGAATSANGAIFKTFSDSCGVVLPLFDLQITGPDGEARPAGEPGEIWVRGSPVTTGYWDDEAANAAAFEGDWFKTGDIGLMTPEGLLYLVDRKKDMVLSAGENIYCAEVERVLNAVDDYVEVALFGVPDARLGERAVAAIVAQAGSGRDGAAVQATVARSLADYKVPREVLFLDEPLPRTHLGKVDKVALRKLYREREA